MTSLGIEALLKNGSKQFNEVSGILIRIADNILQNGSIEKYRSIRIDTVTFQEKLLPYDGAVQCLMEMGFQENNDCFTFFDDENIKDLKKVRDQLFALSKKKTSISPEIVQSQKTIYSRLKSCFQHSRIYENISLQEKARSNIPVDDLKGKAERRLSRSSKQADAPKCTNCHTSDKPMSIGGLAPSQEDLMWGANRVEGYQCQSCSTTIRFPRYNHPEKLLQSRTGRCGEWANCFTLMCRAMGFESRHVLDWTDHVWTEVFIPEWKRWVHCDPCENACDQPLMYEQGWKKKLSLIVATSAEELVDVTWRYSVDRDSVQLRRSAMFNEEWLLEAVESMNQSSSIAISPARRHELVERRKTERSEMEELKKISEEEYEGRSSGSLEWRLARGETRGGAPRNKQMLKSQAVELTDREIESRLFHLEYSCCTDEYKRWSDNDTVIGWDALTFQSHDMTRKEEYDWKQAYLCRQPGSDEGYVCWRFNLPISVHVEKIVLKVQSTVFDTGIVAWLLCSDKNCHVIEPGKTFQFPTEYKDSRVLSIHVWLRGGNGDTSWQKSQLFREPTEPEIFIPSFSFLIRFNEELRT